MKNLLLTVCLLGSFAFSMAQQIVSTVAGSNLPAGYSGDGGAATSAQMRNPTSVALDVNGNIFIADYNNNRIRKVNATTGIITTVAGDGSYDFVGDGGLATSAQFKIPSGVAFDPSGNLYIADSENNRIRKIDMTTGNITTVAGGGAGGVGGYSGDNGPATSAQLNGPFGIAFDASGNLYIADSKNCRVRKVSGGNITTVAGDGSFTFGGDNGPATSAQMAGPTGVAVDAGGNIYIADFNNHRIRKVNASTGVITTIAGNGVAGYAGDNDLAVNAKLNNPVSLVLDGNSNLYISDFNNHRVRKINASSSVITTLVGNGTSGFSGDGNGPVDAQLNNPAGITLDADGNLFVADYNNNRVRKVTNATKENQSITFGAVPTKKFGDAPFIINATGGASGLPVTFTSSNTAVATISGSTVTITGVGTSIITAKQAGNTNYNPAVDVPQVLTVNKGDQAITFGTISNKTLGDAPFLLTASSSATLAIAYSTTSDKVTLAGNTVTIVKPGSVTISADQPGNANFNPAARVSQTFCINPAKPTISVSNGNTATPTLTSSASTGNQWYKDGVIVAGQTNNTLTVAVDGSYSVDVTVETCKSLRSSDVPVVITGDISIINTNIEVSPNPASDMINMKLPGEGRKEIGIFSVNGALKESTSTDHDEMNLDVRQYAAGFYLMRIRTASEIYFGKFIKN